MDLKELDWRGTFPEKEPRETQEEVLDSVIENWPDHKYFIIEAPTGVGKSAIGFALARWLRKNVDPDYSDQEFQGHATYLTTINIALQEVYEQSYSHLGMLKLYSADNFTCVRPPRNMTCGDARRSPKNAGGGSPEGCEGRCPYVAAKRRFIDGDHGVLNFPYYLHETNYAGQLLPRGLLVIDEAHNLPDALRDFSSIEFTKKTLDEYVLQPPTFKRDDTMDPLEFQEWLQANCIPKAKAHRKVIREQISGWKGSESDPQFIKLLKKENEVDRAVCKYMRVSSMLTDPDYWVVERRDTSIFATPLSARPFAKQSLFGRERGKCLMMSATILSPEFFRKELGLPKDETFTLQVSSPFPSEHRQVMFYPTGKIDYRDLAGSIAQFKNALDLLLKEHENERGIIFVSSYKQAHAVVDMLKNPRVRTHSGTADRGHLMAFHTSTRNSVLVSPSMHEGVDLKDDLSRFQIILKLPFPSLGSKVIKKRMQQNDEWYAMQVALKLVQATGRSVRSESDWSRTYILDESFGYWFSKWEHLLPPYWKEALVEV